MDSEYKKRQYAKWKSHRRRQRHRTKGLCLECRRKSVSDRRFCAVHLVRARAKAKQEYQWRIANGICIKCGTPKEVVRIGVNCVSCARKAAAKERKRRRTARISVWLTPSIKELEGRNSGLTYNTDQQDERNVA